MPNKKQQEEFWWNDPIAREQRIREREDFRRDMFLPIHQEGEGPRWDIDWIVEGLIPRSYLVMLAGPPKSGKTCLATAMALAVASGVPFAGRKTEQCGVLWIAGEENPYERNLFLRQSPLADPSVPLHTCHQPFQIDNDEYLDALDYWVDETRAGLIVIDPLLGAIAGRSLTDSWNARKTLKAFKLFCHQKRVAGLVLHHTKRSDHSYGRQRVADNAQLMATASMNIILSHRPAHDLPSIPMEGAGGGLGSIPMEGAGGGLGSIPMEGAGGGLPKIQTLNSQPAQRLICLSCSGRGAWANGTSYVLSQGPLDYRQTDGQQPVIEERPPTYTEGKILSFMLDGEKTTCEMIETLSLRESTCRNAVTNLRREGHLFIARVQKQTRFYKLTESGQKLGKIQKLELEKAA